MLDLLLSVCSEYVVWISVVVVFIMVVYFVFWSGSGDNIGG